MTRPAPGLGDTCLMCGTTDAAVLNIVSGEANGRREFDTVCDRDMNADWPTLFRVKYRERVEVGSCALCGYEMGRAWEADKIVDVWHPAGKTPPGGCPPEPEGHPPSPEWEAFYAKYRPGRPGVEHFRLEPAKVTPLRRPVSGVDGLSHRARAFSGSNRDETIIEGVIVGYCDGPQYAIRSDDGNQIWWREELVEVGPEVGDHEIPRHARHRPQTADLSYVVIEQPEPYCHAERNDYGTVESYTAEPALLPPGDWAAALDMVMARPDEVMCAFSELTDEATGQMCANMVGWVLHEDDDEPWKSGWTWKHTVLVKTPGGVVAVCEDDSPDVLYENALDNIRKVAGFTD